MRARAMNQRPIDSENRRRGLEWRLPLRAVAMTEPTSAEPVLAWLWELPDGTRAAVVEHAAAPQWELRIVKGGRVIECERCASLSELIAAAMAAHYKADSRN